MIKIANNLQRLVKAANNPTPAEQEAAMRQIMGLMGVNPQLSGNMIGAMQQTQLKNQAMGMTPEQAQFASPEAIQARMNQRNTALGVPAAQPVQPNMASIDPAALGRAAFAGVNTGVASMPTLFQQALRSSDDMFSINPLFMRPQQPQFTPSPAQQQFAQTAMGIPQDQAQFASPEAVRARMSARNQRHTPAPNLMSPMPKPDYRKF